MNKKALIRSLISVLETELANLDKAARAAHEAATHEEAIAEDKYDTRGLEASYLAAAQQARLRELRATIAHYKTLPVRGFDEDDEIETTAVVDLEANGQTGRYFLAPWAGGVRFPFEGHEILVITPASPLGQELLGKCVGDEVTVAAGSGRVHEIVGIC